MKRGVVITLILLFGLGVFTGYMLYQNNRSKTETTENRQNQSEYQPPAGFKTYSDSELGITFAYPQEWGEVQRRVINAQAAQNPDFKGNGIALDVGPLHIKAESRDFSTLGGGDPLLTISRGYTQREGKYYSNTSIGGTQFVLEEEQDVFRTVATQNGEALLRGKNCPQEENCSITGLINLKGQTYPGLGIRYDREFFGKKEAGIPPKDFDAAISEYEKVLQTFQVQ